MGASFRNTSQIIELAGCDLLTISPELLQKLSDSDMPVTRKLNQENARQDPVEKTSYDEKGFRLALNNDAMATEKLSEGIRLFAVDQRKLEDLLAAKL